jgi:hypothetical protein
MVTSMVNKAEELSTLSPQAAKQLATVTTTVAQWDAITPRWLVNLLPWNPVQAGVFRVNRVKDPATNIESDVACSPLGEKVVPDSFVDYEENPREYTLNAVTTILEVRTRVSDLYSFPHDQVREQLRLTIEKVKERQEFELLNHPGYGLLNQVEDSQTITSNSGLPTPDALDELISKVWKQPSFFLAHPTTIAAIGREFTRRGVPPQILTLFGEQFLSWRGLPIIPTDKIAIDKNNKSSILLVRAGQEKQGVIGLFQPGIPGEVTPSLSVRFAGIDHRAIASYLVSLYCSAAVLSKDAIGLLEGVDVATYHDYK